MFTFLEKEIKMEVVNYKIKRRLQNEGLPFGLSSLLAALVFIDMLGYFSVKGM